MNGSQAEREEFMRMMGISQDDLQDPATRLRRAPRRAPGQPSAGLGAAPAAAAPAGRAPQPGASQPPQPQPQQPFEDAEEEALFAAAARAPGYSAEEHRARREAFLRELGLDGDPTLQADAAPRHGRRASGGGGAGGPSPTEFYKEYFGYSGGPAGRQRPTPPPPLAREDVDWGAGGGGVIEPDLDLGGRVRPPPPTPPPRNATAAAASAGGEDAQPARGPAASSHFSGGDVLPDPPARRPAPRAAPADAPANATDAILAAEDFKSLGNDEFERGAFPEAARLYQAGVAALHGVDAAAGGGGGTFSEESPAVVLLAALRSNRSAALLLSAGPGDGAPAPPGVLEGALEEAAQAVELRPRWYKGYSRQGDVYRRMGRFHQAVEAYEMGLHLRPGNAALSRLADECRAAARARTREATSAAAAGRRAAPDSPPPTTSLHEQMRREQQQQYGDAEGPPRRVSAVDRQMQQQQQQQQQARARGGGSGGVAPEAEPIVHFAASHTRTANDAFAATSEFADDGDGSGEVYGDAAWFRLRPEAAMGGRGGGRMGVSDGAGGVTDVRASWQRLRAEVERSCEAPTGNDYRQQQLERFRQQRAAGAGAGSGGGFGRRGVTATGGSDTAAAPPPPPPTDTNGGDPVRAASADTGGVDGSSGGGGGTRQSASEPPGAAPPSGAVGKVDIANRPYEFSSAAAAAYQQKLMEEYRRRKCGL